MVFKTEELKKPNIQQPPKLTLLVYVTKLGLIVRQQL
jgi:hypothetical protein